MDAARFASVDAAPEAPERAPSSIPSVADLADALACNATSARKDDGYETPPRDRDPGKGKTDSLSSASGAVGAAAAGAGSHASPAVSGVANKRKRADMTSSAISEAAETAASLLAASNPHDHLTIAQYHALGGSTARLGRAMDIGAPAGKRKSSSDYLRKGQWTTTEERLARLLIEAFEEGYLPVYTGIRLRGYLAVQLQCDPMRVSKKLCAGTVDGKRVPKNYGQKKFKLRKKASWDRDEAGRILAALEKLTDDLWRESAVARPPFLTLSSTRNADDEEPPAAPRDTESSPNSPVRRLSPSVSKKHKSVVFPIIYLNLSKKHKQHASVSSNHNTSSNSNSSSSSSEADPVGDSTPSMSEDDDDVDSSRKRPKKALKASAGKRKPVDGESLQAAYDLLTLCQPSQTDAPSGGKQPTAAKSTASASSRPPAVEASAP